MRKEFERFTVSQVAVLIRDKKCLILEFADKKGYWGLPGGRIDKGEMSEPAFRRELEEELTLRDFEIIDVVDFDVWYPNNRKPASAIVFLIKNEYDEITLSDEHSRMKWVSESELDDYTFWWTNAKRMLRNGFSKHRDLNVAC